MILYIENSKNSKIGKIDATYAPIEQTCPDTCQLKDNGCFASLSFVGIHNTRIEKLSIGTPKVALAKEEADLIKLHADSKTKSKYLRIHVSGDSTTITGTKLLAKAANSWIKNEDERVYTYTHAWNKVERKHWGNISCLASVDSEDQISKAKLNGYAVAIVVPEFTSKKAYLSTDKRTKFVPCPNQTVGVSCEQCKLCFNDEYLINNNVGIAFAAHGVKKNNIKRRLNVI